MAGIDELKSLIGQKDGLARTNQFLIQIPNVNTLRLPVFEQLSFLGIGNNSSSSRELNILCKTTQIPGRQITTRERGIGMQPETAAYGYQVNDVTMTFHILNDYGVVKFFEGWKNSIINEEVSEVKYKVDYQKDIRIHQLKRPINNREFSLGPVTFSFENNCIYSVVLENAFPTQIQAIDFNNEPNSIGELTVQISYSNVKHINSPLGNLSLSSIGGISQLLGI